MSKEALEVSIKKWENIARDRRYKDKGVENCALCKSYYDSNCENCPVANKSRNIWCDNTPHEKWSNHLCNDHNLFGNAGRQKNCIKCLELAKEERKFLESLREIYKEDI